MGSNAPIIQHLIQVYKLWFDLFLKLPKTSRYTMGLKIDGLFMEIMESSANAAYASKEHKVLFLRRAIAKLDVLKMFFQIAWETKVLDDKKYLLLSEPMNEIGQMLGGWQKKMEKETPPH